MDQSLDLRRYWLILLAALLAGATAYIVSTRFVTPEYEARTRLLVQPSSATSGVGYQDVLAGQQVALTYAELLRGASIRQEALQRLEAQVADGSVPAYKQPLSFSVAVERLRDTGILELTITSTDPRLAADLANAIAQVFIQDSSGRQQARFSASKSALQTQMDSVNEDIARTKGQLDSASGEDRARLQSQLTQLQDTLARLNSSFQAVQVAEIQSVDLLTVVESAPLPTAPVRPKVLQNTLLAAVVGAMLGAGVAFLIEYLDTSVRSPEQAEAATQSTILAQIWETPQLARAPSNGTDPLVQGTHSPAAEAFRVLRTNLHFASVDKPLRSLLVTSALPGEGKTLVALNLGAALAMAGQKVILLDADMRRPAMSRYVRAPHQPGLTEALFDRQGNLESYLLVVDGAPSLRILASGALPPDPHEVLASQRMVELLGHLGELADIVVVDSPPVLAAADAAVLAEKVDGVLLVLEAGRTDRRAAAAAAEQLRRSGCRLLGTVMNKVPLAGRHGGYNYYYYNYYSSQYSSEEGSKRTLWQRLFPSRRQKVRRRRPAAAPADNHGSAAEKEVARHSHD